MITADQIDSLTAQATAGRGLWLGLFLDPGALRVDPDLQRVLPDRPHLTLHHLGKRNDAADVAALVKTLTDMRRVGVIGDKGWSGSITGAGWLWRARGPHTTVALVDSHQICDELRAPLVHLLPGSGSRRFGFIPHLTLRQPLPSPAQLAQALGSGAPWHFHVPRVTVVCGDVEVELP